METEIEISVVVPLYNEAHNLEVFFSELHEEMEAYGKPYEVIFVDDGSTDNSQEVLLGIAEQNNYTLVISLRHNVGKAGALEQGFKLASGSKVVIIDCDLQYTPSDIRALVDKIEEGYDVVSGKRVNRADSEGVRLTSWLFRLIVRKLSGLNFDDYFSGLKCFRSNVIAHLGVYGDLNRIFSVYAHRAGFKVCEIPVAHRARRHGKSRYNFLNRLVLGARDLIILFFTVIISRAGLHRFGFLGFGLLSVGSMVIITSFFLSPYAMVREFVGNTLTLIGVLCFYVGWQLRVIEVVGKEFLERHMGAEIFKEYDRRMRNVKYVTPGKRELFEMRRHARPRFLELND